MGGAAHAAANRSRRSAGAHHEPARFGPSDSGCRLIFLPCAGDGGDPNCLTEAEALALTQSLWRLIAARKTVFNGRVFIGGVGRCNETNADLFALLAMEATRIVLEIEPQLTLRFYEGMNPALMAKALDLLAEGRTFPILFNDDVNVPAVEYAFCVSRLDASAVQKPD